MQCPRLLLPLLSLPLMACSATSQSQGAGVPALLLEPDAATHNQVVQAAAKLLQQPSLVLAEDAFSKSSPVVLERSQLPGREMSRPEQLQLMLDGKGCYLLRSSSAATARLPDTRCRAESP